MTAYQARHARPDEQESATRMHQNDERRSLEDFFGPIIHSYTREQAIADGTLHDVTVDALAAGFNHPVAITQAAWADAVAWRKGNKAYQDEIGRLWDVLNMAAVRMRIGKARGEDSDRCLFEVIRIPNTPRATQPRKTKLKLIIGPGDHAEPVITIMRPDED